MRGYVQQYDLGAHLIYTALAIDELRWIGLADRSAGKFDDIVIGLSDRTEAYQVKTSTTPKAFRVDTLLLGASDLLKVMWDARQELIATDCLLPINITYASDDFPAADDQLTEQVGTSSAELLRIHAIYGSVWSLGDWEGSPFGPFVRRVQQASGLDEEVFLTFWQSTRFWHTSMGRIQLDEYHPKDRERLEKLAGLLPRMVADKTNRDRWTREDLLDSLGWRDPFHPRHRHVFPVDAWYQSNETTRIKLASALKVTRGYVSLIGEPGSGKSNLLTADMLPVPRAHIVRYIAFIPNEGHGLGRAEASDFLHDLIQQLKLQGLGSKIMPLGDLNEMRAGFEELLGEVHDRFQKTGVPTVIVVDGLDHVPREENPAHSFLSELPQPQAVPEGAVFILASQRLDLAGLARSVRDQASEVGRRVDMSPLSREAVLSMAEVAQVPRDVDRALLFERTGGHPLSCRYVIRGLLDAKSPEDRQEWLRNGPAYGGEINAFYDRVWHDLEDQSEAREALAFLALAEAPLALKDLDHLVGAGPADGAFQAAKHLFRRDKADRWSIFHNSFRLYLQNKLSVRHGVPDVDRVKARLRNLADLAHQSTPDSPQHWLELRYRARMDDHESVARIAHPVYFRQQFFDGRHQAEIIADLRFAFEAAKVLLRVDLMVDLILSQHEIVMRSSMFGDELFDAYLAIGDLDAARHLLEAHGTSLTDSKGYELIDALLSADRVDDARNVFQEIEPLDKLLGAVSVNLGWGDSKLTEWAERALAFRSPAEFMASIERLQIEEHRLAARDADDGRHYLQIRGLFGQLRRRPDLDPPELAVGLDLLTGNDPRFWYFSAQEAFLAKRPELASRRLACALEDTASMARKARIDAAVLAVRVDSPELAAKFIAGVDPPLLYRGGLPETEHVLRERAYEVVNWAIIGAKLGVSSDPPTEPPEDIYELLYRYQLRLATLGQLLGQARAGRRSTGDGLTEIRRTLDFLQLAGAKDPHVSGRYLLDQTMHVALEVMLNLAAALEGDTFERCVLLIDECLSSQANRLNTPKFRRAYAMALAQHGYDAAAASDRLALNKLDQARSPSAAIAEIACDAVILADLGLKEQALTLLSQIHAQGLGFDRAPKKDAQYWLWREAFAKANHVDPEGRPNRLAFFGRLLEGMSHLEGRGSARRMVGTFLVEAVHHDASSAAAAADFVEATGLATWPELVSSLVTGVAETRPELARVACQVVGRLVVPMLTEHDDNPYPALLAAAPPEAIAAMSESALTCLATHASPSRRIAWMKEVATAARTRGLAIGDGVIARWQQELPPPSFPSREDNFFVEVQTLDAFVAKLPEAGEMELQWAAEAFVRLAPQNGYQATRQVFDANPGLMGNVDCIEAIIKAAHTEDQIDEAQELLLELKKIADDRGTWAGGWQSDATQRYHRLKILLDGQAAEAAAFEAFLDDLRHGGEYVETLIPSLSSVIELLSPRPAWPAVWSACERYLAEYRDYRLGSNFLLPVAKQAPLAVIVDILFRAIETTGLDIIRLVHVTAGELLDLPFGPDIVLALVGRLLDSHANNLFEGAQIAWACRQNETIRTRMLARLPALVESEDLAVRRIALQLADQWGASVIPKKAALPAFYNLDLPQDDQAEHFEPPSGTSKYSSGLWTEDPYTWTWPLERPLRAASRYSGIKISVLRRRAAQFMAAQGGIRAFGPPALARQTTLFKSLDLHITHHKLGVRAAFLAMRQLLGELAAARAIDPSVLPMILRDSGAYDPCFPARPPLPRPVGVSRPKSSTHRDRSKEANWLALVEHDLSAPTIEAYLVLAAAACFLGADFDKRFILEQFYGPNWGEPEPGIDEELERLPQLELADELIPLYRDEADGAVVLLLPDIARSLATHAMTICPRVAHALGWHRDPENPLVLLNATNELMAKTMFWRDGGITSEPHSGLVGQGSLLFASPAGAAGLHPYLSRSNVTRAWRSIIDRQGSSHRTCRATQE